MSEAVAYKILKADEWRALEAERVFPGTALDLSDGYIHLSTAAQLAETAARHFAGQEGLVVAAVDIAALGGLIRWEVSRGGALFPHLYAPLEQGMLLWAEPMPLGPDGRHVPPRGSPA